ncbi:MAG: MATE family efflux transporter [Cyanophyceae cyanobacterium]
MSPTPSLSLGSRFGRLAVVNILSNVTVPLASLIDTAFLGHLPDPDPLAGVALATLLFNVFYWSFGFLRMSTTGLTAQAVGRQDRAAILAVGLRSAGMAVVIGLGLLALQQPLGYWGFELIQGTPEVKAAGQLYFGSRLWGAPAYLLNLAALGWFLGLEKGGRVLVLAVVGNGANIWLNYELIVRRGMSSLGAGWATALSDWIALGVALIIAIPLIRQYPLRAALAQVWDPVEIRRIGQLNGDIWLRTLMMVGSFSGFTMLSATLGTVVLAAHTLMIQAVSLAAYFIDGFAFATESLAGIFYGQRDSLRLRALLGMSGRASLFTGILFGLFMVMMPDFWFGLLTQQTALLDHIRTHVGWLVPMLGFGSLAYMLDGYFLGLTQGRILRWSSIAATGLGFVPLAVVAGSLGNSHLLWLAMVGFMAGRVISLALWVPFSLQFGIHVRT